MLYDVIKKASMMSDSVIVAFSGGKDSVVTLDLCHRYFKKVFVFFMYLVEGLEFQERLLRFYENKYGLEIYRIPHFELSFYLKYGYYRLPDENVPNIKVNDIYNHVRLVSGIEWIAAGERINDSIWRRAMIKQGGSIVASRRRFFPVAYFSKSHVMSYIKTNRLPYALESKYLKRGSSFGDLSPIAIYEIKQAYPDDYEIIRQWFPFIEATVKKYEIHGTKGGGVK